MSTGASSSSQSCGAPALGHPTSLGTAPPQLPHTAADGHRGRTFSNPLMFLYELLVSMY